MVSTVQLNDLPTHILIAEDSITQAEQLRYTLEQQGYNVSVAKNGRQAMEMALKDKPALVISDVVMPEMDGYELSRQIKAHPALSDIPIILVTTLSDPLDVIKGLECGADNFILKPYEERYLLGRVQYVLINREFHAIQETNMGVEIIFNDKRHYITSNRLQVLNLLLSTYEAAVRQNHELKKAHRSLESQAAELLRANRFLDSVIENIPNMVFVKEASTLRHIRLNRSGEELLGCSRSQIIGKSDYDLFQKEQADFFRAADQEVLEQGVIKDIPEELIETPRGIRVLHTKKVPISDEYGYPTHLLGISEDVTEQKAMENEIRRLNARLEERAEKLEAVNEEQQQKLNYLTLFDFLTGLPNRHLLVERLTQSMQACAQSKTRLALIVISIRGLDTVNHLCGKEGGDELLKLVAKRLSNDTRNQMARIGGNQFVCYLSGISNDTELASSLNHSILHPLKEPFFIGAQELNVTVHCGVALFPADGTEAESLIRNAEAALKKAKNHARDFFFFTPDLNQRMIGRLLLENQLRWAIAREEFCLFYQPKISAKDGQVTGFEALIRWKSPERGMVAPCDFIPLLEETGLILEVGQWVVSQAMSDYQTWQEQGLAAVPIAINISPIQLRDSTFFNSLMQRQADYGNEGTRALELEITETVLMENIESAAPELHCLREAGYKISIDDFGTGYSSFSYLPRLPLNALKIDRSFVRDLGKNDEQRTIVSMIIVLAHALKLKVIAEGVETELQKAQLQSLGCDELQGYLLGKPMPAEEAKLLLKRRHYS